MSAMTRPAVEAHPPTVRVGFDLASISAVADSLRRFGHRFADRLFTADEQSYALCGHGLFAERLAARFAAKEAVIKALQLSETGVNWRDIEVVKLGSGDCDVVLHGRAAEIASGLGATQLLLSMSHDGDYAGATVFVAFNQPVL